MDHIGANLAKIEQNIKVNSADPIALHCLDSNKQVVYNSASDACLSSTRATKHEISPLVVDAIEQVLALQPVSFVYNDGDGRTRYGFIAEDTAAVDAHLATYDASNTISGIDDRAILATVVKAIKDLYAQVREYFARTEQLEERVSALEAQLAASVAAGPSADDGQLLEAPAASSEPESPDTATTTMPVESDPITPEAANDNQPVADGENDPQMQEATEPASEVVSDPVLIPEPANDNTFFQLTATGTE